CTCTNTCTQIPTSPICALPIFISGSQPPCLATRSQTTPTESPLRQHTHLLDPRIILRVPPIFNFRLTFWPADIDERRTTTTSPNSHEQQPVRSNCPCSDTTCGLDSSPVRHSTIHTSRPGKLSRKNKEYLVITLASPGSTICTLEFDSC